MHQLSLHQSCLMLQDAKIRTVNAPYYSMAITFPTSFHCLHEAINKVSTLVWNHTAESKYKSWKQLNHPKSAGRERKSIYLFIICCFSSSILLKQVVIHQLTDQNFIQQFN